jgi:uncharacterized protein (UPF0332 family)
MTYLPWLEKAQENILSAEILHDKALYDIAASRAYYALFYTAQALLTTRGLSFSKHSAVIAAYGKEFAKTGALDTKFHHWLVDAQDARTIGDYSALIRIPEHKTQEMIAWAKEFLEAARQYIATLSP